MRRLAALLVLAGCAAPNGGERFLLLESDSYGCGAADGLGCGLALAPVLNRMDALDGVAESRVSWDGRWFRLDVEPGADRERIAAEAAALLEGEACCVTESRGAAAPSGPREWFDERQTVELSRHEAEVIAARHAAAITAEVALEPTRAERLRAVLLEELVRAFEAAHAAGGGVHRLWEQLPAARARFEARAAEFLTPDQIERVGAVIDRELER